MGSEALRTYWRHPESDSYFAADEYPGEGDGMLVELDLEEYLEQIRDHFLALPKPVRVVVFGGRDFRDQDMMDAALDDFERDIGFAVLIEGEAQGADLRAKAWAKKRGIPVEPYPADWDDLSHPDARVRTRRNGTEYDAAAGGRRNQQMIDEGRPDCGIVFPGGSGTADMKDRCELAGIPVFEIGE
ncbi:hypothetical protein FIU93_22965 [Labrenzia sp. THAF35]|nr:hypothetical protein FIU93_22965 [Labrenzia sp. THAF35]